MNFCFELLLGFVIYTEQLIVKILEEIFSIFFRKIPECWSLGLKQWHCALINVFPFNMGNKFSGFQNLLHLTKPNSQFDYYSLPTQATNLDNVALNQQNHTVFNLDFTGNFITIGSKKSKRNVQIKESDIASVEWSTVAKKLEESVIKGLSKGDKVVWIKADIGEEGRIKWIGWICGKLFAGLQLNNHVTITLEGYSCKDLKLPFKCKKIRGPAVVLLSQVIPYETYEQMKRRNSGAPTATIQEQPTTTIPSNEPLQDSNSNVQLNSKEEKLEETKPRITRKDSMALKQNKILERGTRVYFHKKDEYATVIWRGADENNEQICIIEYDNPIGDPTLKPTPDVHFKVGYGRKVSCMKLVAQTLLVTPGENYDSRNYSITPTFELEQDIEMAEEPSASPEKSKDSPNLLEKLCTDSNIEKLERLGLSIPGPSIRPYNNVPDPSYERRRNSFQAKMPKLDLTPGLDKKYARYSSSSESESSPPLKHKIQSSFSSQGERMTEEVAASQEKALLLCGNDLHNTNNDEPGRRSSAPFQKSTYIPRGRGRGLINSRINSKTLETNHDPTLFSWNGKSELRQHATPSPISSRITPEAIRREIEFIENGLKKGDQVLWFSDEPTLPFTGTVKRIFEIGENAFDAIVQFNIANEQDKCRLRFPEDPEGYVVNVAALLPSPESLDVESKNMAKTSSKSKGKRGKRPKKSHELLDENDNLIISSSEPLTSHITETENNATFGYSKGIQGRSNSCYLDATLFSLFYCTNIFDEILLTTNDKDEDKIKEYKDSLRNIVQLLRRNHFVPGSTVMKFRRLIGHFKKELLGSFMDAEDLLFILFGDAFKVPHFFEYTTDMSDYIHQLWAEPSNYATVQQLYENSMEFWGNLKLKNVPKPALILQMPRCNGKLSLDRVIPNLQLDLTKVIDGHFFCPCDNPVTVKCRDCDSDKTGYCEMCVLNTDSLHEGLGHPFNELKVEQNEIPNFKMNLVAVICVGFYHYTAFVKCGNSQTSPWLFFDSAGPQITKISDMHEYLQSLEENPGTSMKVRDGIKSSILRDCHLCIYTM